MASPLPPDPYAALGVAKDASSAEIKTAHRKLALRCHPDKVSEPKEKQAASDLFHKIQTAYEILIDEDRRGRYDAQVRLAELRKDMLRSGGGSLRAQATRSNSDPFKTFPDSPSKPGYHAASSPTMSPQYEERKPAYATSEFCDLPPRATARKEPDYERTSRRYGSDTREKPKASASQRSKENERASRKEKSKRSERETKRDRDRKYNAYVEEDSESTSDEYARRSRLMREEDEQRKAREVYHEQARRQRDEADGGYFVDNRARKMFSQGADAKEYIKSRARPQPEPERRPSPVRMGSSKDKVDYPKRSEVRSSTTSRRPPMRTKMSSREADLLDRGSTRDMQRRSSTENVDESAYRPPSFNQSRSSPSDIRIPTDSRAMADRQRAQTLQTAADAPEIPRIRRSETMPVNSPQRAETTAPPKSSGLRQTEFSSGLPTPVTTPEYSTPSAKFQYGRQYADDAEYATPEGYRTSGDSYRTEVREPTRGSARPQFTRRITRSPSPGADTRQPRERTRPSSSRYPSSSTQQQGPPPVVRTTSYVYTPGQGLETYDPVRHPLSRGGSAREPQAGPLFGEIRNTPEAAPRSTKYDSYVPPAESIRYREIRPEDIKIASGHGYNYSRRPSTDKANPSRTNSSNNPIHVR